MLSVLTGIAIAVALVILAYIRGTKPYQETWVVAGERDFWIQKCCDTLETTRSFSEVKVFEDRYEIEAKYHHRPLRWARVRLTFSPHKAGSTEIKAVISALPTPQSAIFPVEPRLASWLSRSLGLDKGSTGAHTSGRLDAGTEADRQRSEEDIQAV